MKFVRHAKKQAKDLGVQARVKELTSQDMAFQEIEEYFVYTPKANYPTGNPAAAGDQKGVKFSKDSITIAPQVL